MTNIQHSRTKQKTNLTTEFVERFRQQVATPLGRETRLRPYPYPKDLAEEDSEEISRTLSYVTARNSQTRSWSHVYDKPSPEACRQLGIPYHQLKPVKKDFLRRLYLALRDDPEACRAFADLLWEGRN